MRRLIKAFKNSGAGFAHLLRHEAAFQQEFFLFLVAIPAGYIFAQNMFEYLLLLAVVVVIMLVEALNTAIEAVCDALSPDFDPNIKIAKDCGSLAVTMAFCIAISVWVLAIVNWAID